MIETKNICVRFDINQYLTVSFMLLTIITVTTNCGFFLRYEYDPVIYYLYIVVDRILWVIALIEHNLKLIPFDLYRVTCRSGVCTTPLHVTSSQLIASEIFPVPLVKGLLYPGAALNGFIHNMTVPSWGDLLDLYNLTTVKEAPAVTDLQRLEVSPFKLHLLSFHDSDNLVIVFPLVKITLFSLC